MTKKLKLRGKRGMLLVEKHKVISQRNEQNETHSHDFNLELLKHGRGASQ